jgi:hypothetical protein
LDTGIDFIQPEFLNILFFQQKNLVIFPYVDLKHLHTLEIFTAGHNIVDIESTALHNIREIVEYEAYNINPSFFFIYNINLDKIKEIMTIDNVRCVINTNERVDKLLNREDFVFYNKKNKSFTNYDKSQIDLEFERDLISSSENEVILQDKIQKIKAEATRIFTEINRNGELKGLPEILNDYEQKYWNKILKFVKIYYKIELPKINKNYNSPKKRVIKDKKPNKTLLKDFSDEYEMIISQNKNLGKEFVQLLHDYRSKHVNPSNLDLEQLYNPQKLYNYLRNHHWNPQISEDFLIDWIKMENTRFKLTDSDITDFERIFRYLKIPDDILTQSITNILDYNDGNEYKHSQDAKLTSEDNDKIDIPSIKSFPEFKKWLLKKIEDIEHLIG